jgi:hypothetical protein
MKRDLGLDEGESRGRPSRLTERTAHTTEDPVEPTHETEPAADEPVTPAPDEPENEGVADVKTGPTAPRRNRPRNRRHGRRR